MFKLTVLVQPSDEGGFTESFARRALSRIREFQEVSGDPETWDLAAKTRVAVCFLSQASNVDDITEGALSRGLGVIQPVPLQDALKVLQGCRDALRWPDWYSKLRLWIRWQYSMLKAACTVS